MAQKEEGERFKGKVIEVLRGFEYKVQLQENDKTVLAHSSGKMRKNKIKILLGDEVVVLMRLNYDVNRGIIVERASVGGKFGGFRKRT